MQNEKCGGLLALCLSHRHSVTILEGLLLHSRLAVGSGVDELDLDMSCSCGSWTACCQDREKQLSAWASNCNTRSNFEFELLKDSTLLAVHFFWQDSSRVRACARPEFEFVELCDGEREVRRNAAGNLVYMR